MTTRFRAVTIDNHMGGHSSGTIPYDMRSRYHARVQMYSRLQKKKSRSCVDQRNALTATQSIRLSMVLRQGSVTEATRRCKRPIQALLGQTAEFHQPWLQQRPEALDLVHVNTLV